VAAVVGGELAAVGGLLDRGVDAVAGAFVVGVGQGRQVQLPLYDRSSGKPSPVRAGATARAEPRELVTRGVRVRTPDRFSSGLAESMHSLLGVGVRLPRRRCRQGSRRADRHERASRAGGYVGSEVVVG